LAALLATGAFLVTRAACPGGPGALAAEQPQSASAPAASFQQLAADAAKAQEAGRSDEALSLYRKALEIQPKWADGWGNVGTLLANQHDFKRAESAFHHLLDINPKDSSAWAMLGLSEYQEGKLESALADLQRARALGIPHASLSHLATYHAALILIQHGEFPRADSLLRVLAKLQVDNPEVVMALGLAALCIPASPDKVPADKKPLVVRVGQIQMAAAHAPVEETIAKYEKLLSDEPRAAGLHYAFGYFLADVRRYNRALAEMQAELEVNPKNVLALLELDLTNVRMGRSDEGLPYAEKAASLAPNICVTHYALGWTLYNLGQSERAIRELEQAVKLEPSDAKAHYALSQAYAQAHRKSDALRESQIFTSLKRQQTTNPSSQ
jgi:tetratricopeptide (TPR) repeat protein